jgi:hypothetical protein
MGDREIRKIKAGKSGNRYVIEIGLFCKKQYDGYLERQTFIRYADASRKGRCYSYRPSRIEGLPYCSDEENEANELLMEEIEKIDLEE